MEGNTVLHQLMAVWMENVMRGITEIDTLYQETKQRSGEYSYKLEALQLPRETKLFLSNNRRFQHNSAKPQTIWQNPYNLAKLNFLAKVRGFAKKYPSFHNRHVISGIKKRQKERLTSRPGEPLQARNS